MTMTGAPTTAALPAPARRRRFRWWCLLFLWPGLIMFSMLQSTWQGFDVYADAFHGLDTHARDLAGQGWVLDKTASSNLNAVDHSYYVVTDLSAGDTVQTWTDVTQNGHFGIPTRIDSIAAPTEPIDIAQATVTRDSEGHVYPPHGSPIGSVTELPATLKPGDLVQLNLTWSLRSCHVPGAQPRTFSVSSVELHETVLGVHRTRLLPLGFTLTMSEPTCTTG